MSSHSSKITLPQLPYHYNALEPVISEEIMKVHHTLDHQTYVDTANGILEMMEEAKSKGDHAAMLSLGCGLKFALGGHLNHCLFWENLCPAKERGEPSAELVAGIKEKWGTLEDMMDEFNKKAGAIKGSGWGWLGLCPKTQTLCITECSNQDPLEATTGLIPLLGVDVWEHAYFSQYKNKRSEYLQNIWKVVNWNVVSERYTNALLTKSNVYKVLYTPIDTPSKITVKSAWAEQHHQKGLKRSSEQTGSQEKKNESASKRSRSEQDENDEDMKGEDDEKTRGSQRGRSAPRDRTSKSRSKRDDAEKDNDDMSEDEEETGTQGSGRGSQSRSRAGKGGRAQGQKRAASSSQSSARGRKQSVGG